MSGTGHPAYAAELARVNAPSIIVEGFGGGRGGREVERIMIG